jgi:hypothetical protein
MTQRAGTSDVQLPGHEEPIAPVTILVASTTSTPLGSSGPARLSSSAMCTAAGGTYSDGTCEPARDTRTAQQMCEAHNGTYFAGGDYCEVAGIRKP